MSTRNAALLLHTTALLWGSQHAAIKLSVDGTAAAGVAGATAVVALRFAVAALASGGLACAQSQCARSELPRALREGARIGALCALSFSLHAFGLQSTTARLALLRPRANLQAPS